MTAKTKRDRSAFPFLLGGAFIEARNRLFSPAAGLPFPFLLGGAFIEAEFYPHVSRGTPRISLPSWRGFH